MFRAMVNAFAYVNNRVLGTRDHTLQA